MGEDEHDLRDLIAAWHRVTAAGDRDAVFGVIAGDAVFLVAGTLRSSRL